MSQRRAPGSDDLVEELFAGPGTIIATSVDEASRMSGLSTRELYLAMKRGELEFCKRGRRRLVLFDSLRKLVLSHRVAA